MARKSALLKLFTVALLCFPGLFYTPCQAQPPDRGGSGSDGPLSWEKATAKAAVALLFAEQPQVARTLQGIIDETQHLLRGQLTRDVDTMLTVHDTPDSFLRAGLLRRLPDLLTIIYRAGGTLTDAINRLEEDPQDAERAPLSTFGRLHLLRRPGKVNMETLATVAAFEKVVRPIAAQHRAFFIGLFLLEETDKLDLVARALGHLSTDPSPDQVATVINRLGLLSRFNGRAVHDLLRRKLPTPDWQAFVAVLHTKLDELLTVWVDALVGNGAAERLFSGIQQGTPQRHRITQKLLLLATYSDSNAATVKRVVADAVHAAAQRTQQPGAAPQPLDADYTTAPITAKVSKTDHQSAVALAYRHAFQAAALPDEQHHWLHRRVAELPRQDRQGLEQFAANVRRRVVTASRLLVDPHFDEATVGWLNGLTERQQTQWTLDQCRPLIPQVVQRFHELQALQAWILLAQFERGSDDKVAAPMANAAAVFLAAYYRFAGRSDLAAAHTRLGASLEGAERFAAGGAKKATLRVEDGRGTFELLDLALDNPIDLPQADSDSDPKATPYINSHTLQLWSAFDNGRWVMTRDLYDRTTAVAPYGLFDFDKGGERALVLGESLQAAGTLYRSTMHAFLAAKAQLISATAENLPVYVVDLQPSRDVPVKLRPTDAKSDQVAWTTRLFAETPPTASPGEVLDFVMGRVVVGRGRSIKGDLPPLRPKHLRFLINGLGHSSAQALSLPEALQRLRAQGTRVIVDVRENPVSRFNPAFNRNKLATALPQSGIEYFWMGLTLGNLKADNPERSLEGFQAVRGSESYRQGITTLMSLIALYGGGVTLLCSESDESTCHRRYILEDIDTTLAKIRSVPDPILLKQNAKLVGELLVVFQPKLVADLDLMPDADADTIHATRELILNIAAVLAKEEVLPHQTRRMLENRMRLTAGNATATTLNPTQLDIVTAVMRQFDAHTWLRGSFQLNLANLPARVQLARQSVAFPTLKALKGVW